MADQTNRNQLATPAQPAVHTVYLQGTINRGSGILSLAVTSVALLALKGQTIRIEAIETNVGQLEGTGIPTPDEKLAYDSAEDQTAPWILVKFVPLDRAKE